MMTNAQSRRGLDVECAELLAAQGAIMTIGCSPAQHFLVGDFAWVGPHHVYWFAANGDSTADAHLLEFEEVHREGSSVHFFVAGRRVAALAAIDATDVDDPDDFRIAWQIWQQVAPMRGTLLARSRKATQVVRETDAKSPAPVTPANKSKRKGRRNRSGLAHSRHDIAARYRLPTNARLQSSPR